MFNLHHREQAKTRTRNPFQTLLFMYRIGHSNGETSSQFRAQWQRTDAV